MPGSVQNAVASVVFPWILARTFVREIRREVRVSRYLDGRRHSAPFAGAARRSWSLVMDAAPAELDALRSFWLTNRHKAMVFYDVEERGEEGLGWDYDETGAAAGAGKYVVRFEGDDLDAQVGLALSGVTVRLVEVA